MRIAAITLPRVANFPIKTNTGNYLFTEAAYRNISGNPVWVGFNFDPDFVNANFDHVILPAANWINASDGLQGLVNRLKKIELPITCMGLGAQAKSTDSRLEELNLSKTSIELAHVIAEKCVLISVRGAFTQQVLGQLGVSNTIVTGCPSLYMDLPLGKRDTTPTEAIILQGTRYNMGRHFLKSDSLDRRIFALAGKFGHDVIYQSEAFEISYLSGRRPSDWESEVVRAGLHELYGFSDAQGLKSYLDVHGHVFTEIDKWSEFVKLRSGVIGTRLHGVIMALNSGVPAVLLPHDSRTQEIADFAGIPTAHPDEVFEEQSFGVRLPSDMSDKLKNFAATRVENRRIYVEFLMLNGLEFRDSRSNV